MDRIIILLKDGTQEDFQHKPRPGGSYSLSIRYEAAFVVVVDEWGQETAIPVVDVARVVSTPATRY